MFLRENSWRLLATFPLWCLPFWEKKCVLGFWPKEGNTKSKLFWNKIIQIGFNSTNMSFYLLVGTNVCIFGIFLLTKAGAGTRDLRENSLGVDPFPSQVNRLSQTRGRQGPGPKVNWFAKQVNLPSIYWRNGWFTRWLTGGGAVCPHPSEFSLLTQPRDCGGPRSNKTA